MSMPYYKNPNQPPNKPKLHSPLLEGNKKIKLVGENTDENVDETLDKTIFNNRKKSKVKEVIQDTINHSSIEGLETLFKMAGVITLALGSIFCILDLLSIIKLVQEGNPKIINEVVLFVFVLGGTLISNAIFVGFSHLIKTTRILFIKLETQNSRIEKIIKKLEV